MNPDRSSEDRVLAAVRRGVIQIDEQGRCWRSFPWRRAEARRGGYLQLRYGSGPRKGVAQAHRIVYRVLVGEIPAGMTINHRNGDKADNHPDNLEPATYAEQIRHGREVLGVRFGARPGADNHMAKLNPRQVKAIRRRRSAGETLQSIADDFGVVMQHVWKIVQREKWRSVA